LTVKIVGFEVNRDKSTCYYKVKVPNLNPLSMDYQISKGSVKTEKEFNKEIEAVLGHYLRLALLKSDFVSVRK